MNENGQPRFINNGAHIWVKGRLVVGEIESKMLLISIAPAPALRNALPKRPDVKDSEISQKECACASSDPDPWGRFPVPKMTV